MSLTLILKRFSWGFLLFLGGTSHSVAQDLSPEEALRIAYANNPEIQASVAEAASERALIRSRSWLDNPRFGLMREAGMSAMQESLGPMNSWSVSQELLFPTKYFSLRSAQSSRSQVAEARAEQTRLSVRQSVLTSYYSLYSAKRILALLEAQKETLREISRIAEARRATGAVPQQDEMKAHVEQTLIEKNLILRRQEIAELQARFNALLDRDPGEEISIRSARIEPPKLNERFEEIEKIALRESHEVRAQRKEVEEVSSARTLAKMGYLPDIMLSYRKPFTNSPEGAFVASVEISVPLWFFINQSSQVSAASANLLRAEKNLQKRVRETQAEARSTFERVKALDELMKIYQTSLVPQATSTLNSSRAAYSAGRTGFQELLDSERSLYEVRIGYYESLSKFVESLSGLEKIVGTSLSTLPFGGNE